MTFLTRNWRAVSSTMASVMLVGLVAIGGGIVAATITSQPPPEEVPSTDLIVAAPDGDTVTVMHNGGDPLSEQEFLLTVNGEEIDPDTLTITGGDGDWPFEVGETITYHSDEQLETVDVDYGGAVTSTSLRTTDFTGLTAPDFSGTEDLIPPPETQIPTPTPEPGGDVYFLREKGKADLSGTFSFTSASGDTYELVAGTDNQGWLMNMVINGSMFTCLDTNSEDHIENLAIEPDSITSTLTLVSYPQGNGNNGNGNGNNGNGNGNNGNGNQGNGNQGNGNGNNGNKKYTTLIFNGEAIITGESEAMITFSNITPRGENSVLCIDNQQGAGSVIGLYGRASVKISDESGDRWL